MIKVQHGDILSSDARIICHQVNCKGVMGAGLAKRIKEANPRMFQEYRNLCKRFGFENLSSALILPTDATRKLPESEQRFIANCFGQSDYGTQRCYTNYSALEHSLWKVRRFATARNGLSVAIPLEMGCGLAGGDWNVVSSIIEGVFQYATDISVTYWSLDKKESSSFGLQPMSFT